MKNKYLRIKYIISILLNEHNSKKDRKKITNLLDADFNQHGQHYEEYSSIHLKKMINLALTLPFYKAFFDKSNLSDISLSDFPIIDKSIIKENKELLIVKSNSPRTQRNTGGSTGQPFTLLSSPELRNIEIAHQEYFYQRMGFIKGDKIYSIDGFRPNRRSINKNVFWRKNHINGFPYGHLRFSASDMHSSNVRHYYEKILKDKPQYLRGYPSALTMLAQYILDNGVYSEFIKGVMLTSEMIKMPQIETCYKAFNAPIMPQYGMAEACAFGFTAQQSLKYYLSPYYGSIEIVDENGCHVNKGESGQIVVTSYHNMVQPMIRYRTGDIAEYGGIHNGFPVLNKIMGRTQDYLINKDNQKIMIVGLIHGSHFEPLNHIRHWQIIQNTIGAVEVVIDQTNTWEKKHELEVKKLLSFNTTLSVSIRYGENFIKSNAGKKLFVVQQIK